MKQPKTTLLCIVISDSGAVLPPFLVPVSPDCSIADLQDLIISVGPQVLSEYRKPDLFFWTPAPEFPLLSVPWKDTIARLKSYQLNTAESEDPKVVLMIPSPKIRVSSYFDMSFETTDCVDVLVHFSTGRLTKRTRDQTIEVRCYIIGEESPFVIPKPNSFEALKAAIRSNMSLLSDCRMWPVSIPETLLWESVPAFDLQTVPLNDRTGLDKQIDDFPAGHVHILVLPVASQG